MVLHLLIHESHLLKDLKNDFLHIIISLHNIKRLMLLLIPILSLHPFHLKNIKCDLAHFNSAELRRVRVSCLADKSVFIPCVVFLALDQLVLVLVELVVQVEEIDRGHIHFVHVLGQRVS